MNDRVTIRIDDHVAEVVLNRPEKMNALDPALIEALTDAGRSLAGDAGLRCVILRGAGGNFSAGLDLELFRQQDQRLQALIESGFDVADGDVANAFQLPALVWRRLPVPVIAALEGVCFGGGMQIALGPDFRLAAPDAQLSIMEIRWGLVPDMSATQSLRDLVALDVAKELTMTGRIVNGTEAAALGLVTRTCEDPVAEARRLAAEIAARSPDAVRAAKRLFDGAWHAPSADGLALEARLQRRLIGGPNMIESVMSTMDKRAPDFRPASIDLD